MKKVKFWAVILSIPAVISCGESNEANQAATELGSAEENITTNEVSYDRVLTEEERDALRPIDVIAEFKEGNQRFIADSLTLRDRQARRKQTGEGQFPKAMVLSCIDSRVPVEDIFDQGKGDIFVGRVAGNFVDPEMLGSIEFATKVAGSKVVVVLGHEGCGAIKSAIAGVELGNITALLEHLKPSVAMTDGFDEEQQTVENAEYVSAVVEQNVLHTLDEIRSGSPIIAEMENNSEIKLAGAVYDIKTGTVRFLEEPEMD